MFVGAITPNAEKFGLIGRWLVLSKLKWKLLLLLHLLLLLPLLLLPLLLRLLLLLLHLLLLLLLFLLKP